MASIVTTANTNIYLANIFALPDILKGRMWHYNTQPRAKLKHHLIRKKAYPDILYTREPSFESLPTRASTSTLSRSENTHIHIHMYIPVERSGYLSWIPNLTTRAAQEEANGVRQRDPIRELARREKRIPSSLFLMRCWVPGITRGSLICRKSTTS